MNGIAGGLESWEFAGWGKAERITDLGSGPTEVRHLDQPHKNTLGTWRSTAICGNDITPSVLYVSALCAAQAGVLAPVVLLLGFFALCTSILLVTSGRIETLAGVYTLSFLSVMALFAIGNMLLKRTRSKLPRAVRASWPAVTIALFAVLFGILGNVLLEPANVRIFLLYLTVAIGAVGVMFLRIEIMKIGLGISRAIVERVMSVNEWVRSTVMRKINEISSKAVVYFTKGDDVAILNRAALYVLKNEQTSRMQVVHVYRDESTIPKDLAAQLATIDRLYPQLRIDFLAVKGEFGPELIERLSKKLGVEKNYMFSGTPGDRFPHRIQDLGGVRVIL